MNNVTYYKIDEEAARRAKETRATYPREISTNTPEIVPSYAPITKTILYSVAEDASVRVKIVCVQG